MGLGLGFTIGSPLNYMMLERTPAAESNSALATLSLVRSIGTTLAPAILVGFLAHAGLTLQDSLTAQLPTTISAPTLPYAAELQAEFEAMKADPNLKDKLKDVSFPDLNSTTTITISTKDGGSLPDDLVELLRTADVTTITERTVTVAERMFAEQTPSVIADITDGVDSGLASLGTAHTNLDKAHTKLGKAVTGLDKAISGMTRGITGMKSGIAGMTRGITGMDSGLAGTAKAIKGMGAGIARIDRDIAGLKAALAGVQGAYDAIMGALPPGTPEPPPAQELHAKIDGFTAAIAGAREGRAALVEKQAKLKNDRAKLAVQRANLAAKRGTLQRQLVTLERKRADAIASRNKLVKARGEMATALTDLADTSRKLTILRDAVPAAFETAKQEYVAEIRKRSATLETTFASTLNGGFRNIYFSTIAAGLLAALLLALYPRRAARQEAPPASEVDRDTGGPRLDEHALT
ncbi:MAG TPA: hypothetical protein VGK53_15150 [Propionicimonas sp.]